jgi:hypothetical protein
MLEKFANQLLQGQRDVAASEMLMSLARQVTNRRWLPTLFLWLRP